MSRRLCFTLADGSILVQPVGEEHESPNVRYMLPQWRNTPTPVVVKALRDLADAIETYDRGFQ